MFEKYQSTAIDKLNFVFHATHKNCNKLNRADLPTVETDSVRLRARSNSAESWETTNGPVTRSSTRHTWQTAEEESEDNNKVPCKLESYLQSAKLQVG